MAGISGMIAVEMTVDEIETVSIGVVGIERIIDLCMVLPFSVFYEGFPQFVFD